MPPVVVLGGSPARGADGVVLVEGRHDVRAPPGAGGFEFNAVAVTCGARVGVLHAGMVPGKAGPRKAAGRRGVRGRVLTRRMGVAARSGEERIGEPMEEPRLCRAAGYRSRVPWTVGAGATSGSYSARQARASAWADSMVSPAPW